MAKLVQLIFSRQQVNYASDIFVHIPRITFILSFKKKRSNLRGNLSNLGPDTRAPPWGALMPWAPGRGPQSGAPRRSLSSVFH